MNPLFRKHSLLIVSFISLLLACQEHIKPESKKNEQFEGRIIYQIKYPYNQSDPFVNLYPTEMIMDINDTVVYAKINDLGISINTFFNLDSHVVDQFIEIAIPHKKLHVHLTEDDIIKMKNKFPEYTFEKTNIVDNIQGYSKEKIIAIPNDNSEKIELWSTNDIPVDNFNYFGPFSKLQTTLLDFEIENLGFLSRLQATRIQPDTTDIKSPDDFKGYELTSLEEVEKIIDSIFHGPDK